MLVMIWQSLVSHFDVSRRLLQQLVAPKVFHCGLLSCCWSPDMLDQNDFRTLESTDVTPQGQEWSETAGLVIITLALQIPGQARHVL